jgi:hypothetical protein
MMMADTIEIDIRNYLSEDTMQQVALDMWRDMCREACKGNAERIIENIGHSVATSMVAEALGEDAMERIKAKAVNVIDDLTAHTVFRRPDAWDRGPTPAFTALMDAVKANSPLIDKKVRECIAQLSKREALEIIKAGTLQINPSKAA